MKALVLREPGGPLRLEEVERPVPAAGEVLVRVRACGVGLTLVWNRDSRVASSGSLALPRIIGHEVAGDVVAAGPGARRYEPGERVAVYYYLTCGDCRWCNAGREDLCDDLAGAVGRRRDGGLAEYLALPERNLCRVPESVSYPDAAVATDAVATPLHILSSRARLEPGETVLVVGGGGGVGVHAVAVARALGGRPIAVDLGAEKLAAARSAGAVVAIDAAGQDVVEEVAAATGGRGADVVVEFVGTEESLRASLASLGKGGRLVFVGSYDPDARLTINPRLLTRQELALTGSRYCTKHEVEVALRLVAGGQVEPVITRTCRLEEVGDVLAALERKEVVGRAVVTMDGDGGSRRTAS